MFKRFRMGFLLASTAFVFVGIASADDDPALWQTGTNCTGTYWCSSIASALDTYTGYDTLEFVMNNSTTNGIPSWTQTGIMAFTSNGLSTGTVDDLLDFQNVGGNAVIFLYCGDTKCVANDIGLPKSYTATAFATDGGTYTPLASQPGYGESWSNGVGIPAATFAIIDTGANLNGVGKIAVPEPTSVLLLCSVLAIVGAASRRQIHNRA